MRAASRGENAGGAPAARWPDRVLMVPAHETPGSFGNQLADSRMVTRTTSATPRIVESVRRAGAAEPEVAVSDNRLRMQDDPLQFRDRRPVSIPVSRRS